MRAAFAQLWAMLVAMCWLVATGVHVTPYMLGAPRASLRSVADVWKLLRRRTVSGAASLREAWPGVLTSGLGASRADLPMVICFTGTGESPEALLAALRPVTTQLEVLAEADHYVLEVPTSPGAYLNARAFASAIWEILTPCVTGHPGPFVLVGMSRGGLVAMEAGMRIANELAKVATVLALSTPLHVPSRLPPAVRMLAAIEPPLARAWSEIDRAWGPARALMHGIVRITYLRIASMILQDLRMPDPANLAFVREDIALRGLKTSAMRSTREFRLLSEIVPREAELFAADVAGTAARNPRFFASWLWGDADNWVSTADSRAQLELALGREPGAAERVTLGTVPGQGHAQFRERDADDSIVRAQLARVVAEAVDRHARQTERREAAATRQRRMQTRTTDMG